jgi:acyl-CoA thioester hydrolase
MSAPFEHTLRVRYGECDPQGIVFNANYLAWMDQAMVELWRATLGSWNVMLERGGEMVVGEVNVRFRAPARADDLLTVRTAIAGFGNTSLQVAVEILRDDELLVEGRLRQVYLDAATWKPTPVPGWLREALAPHVVADEAQAGIGSSASAP